MNRLIPTVLVWVFGATAALASPILSLRQSGSAASGATYTLAAKPATLALDVHLNTDGLRIDGLDYHINAAAPYASRFSITAGQGPFSAGEVQTSPAAGAAANAAANTSIFRSASGDYPASADYNLMSYAFDLSSLGVGSYVFSPVGNAFTDSPNAVFLTTFGAPGPFTLTITVPEPAGLAFGGIGTALIVLRRTPRSRTY